MRICLIAHKKTNQKDFCINKKIQERSFKLHFFIFFPYSNPKCTLMHLIPFVESPEIKVKVMSESDKQIGLCQFFDNSYGTLFLQGFNVYLYIYFSLLKDRGLPLNI